MGSQQCSISEQQVLRRALLLASQRRNLHVDHSGQILNVKPSPTQP